MLSCAPIFPFAFCFFPISWIFWHFLAVSHWSLPLFHQSLKRNCLSSSWLSEKSKSFWSWLTSKTSCKFILRLRFDVKKVLNASWKCAKQLTKLSSWENFNIFSKSKNMFIASRFLRNFLTDHNPWTDVLGAARFLSWSDMGLSPSFQKVTHF